MEKTSTDLKHTTQALSSVVAAVVAFEAVTTGLFAATLLAFPAWDNDFLVDDFLFSALMMIRSDSCFCFN